MSSTRKNSGTNLRRWRWALVLGTLAMVLLIHIVNGCTSRIGPFKDEINSFMTEVSSARYNDAYMRMGEAYRGRVTSARFREVVSANPYFGGARSFQFRKLIITGGSAALDGVLKTDAGDVAAMFSFSQEGKQWSIVGVTLAGLPAVP